MSEEAQQSRLEEINQADEIPQWNEEKDAEFKRRRPSYY